MNTMSGEEICPLLSSENKPVLEEIGPYRNNPDASFSLQGTNRYVRRDRTLCGSAWRLGERLSDQDTPVCPGALGFCDFLIVLEPST